MNKFVMAVMFVLALAFGVSAQTISNDVRLSAGISNVENSTRFNGTVEVRKSLNDRFGVVGTGTVVTDGQTATVVGQPVLRFSPVEHVFVGGGVQVGKAQHQDAFVNPVLQGGVNFSIDRFNFEPYVQLETPDLASHNTARTLSGNVSVKYAVNGKFGLLGTGAVRATRLDNDFFNGSVERVVTGGVYINF